LAVVDRVVPVKEVSGKEPMFVLLLCHWPQNTPFGRCRVIPAKVDLASNPAFSHVFNSAKNTLKYPMITATFAASNTAR